MKAKISKCVFLDRDGTIIEDGEYVVDIAKLVLKPDAIDCLKKLQNEGFLLVIITNQSGVARGYFTEAEVVKFNDYLVELLHKNGVNINAVYYCPHMLGGVVEGYNVDCDCRKPKIGMFMRAVNEFNVDLSKSFAIGDKTRDLSICGENGCRGFLIDSDGENTEYVTVVNSLTDCVRIITGENL